jgi:hypothetical protein
VATTVHIPKPLLDEVDRRARAEKISRNRFIINALEKAVAAAERGWTPGFFEKMLDIDPADAAAIDEMMRDIRRSRSSKGPPPL